jgi:hypothetical protein
VVTVGQAEKPDEIGVAEIASAAGWTSLNAVESVQNR